MHVTIHSTIEGVPVRRLLEAYARGHAPSPELRALLRRDDVLAALERLAAERQLRGPDPMLVGGPILEVLPWAG